MLRSKSVGLVVSLCCACWLTWQAACWAVEPRLRLRDAISWSIDKTIDVTSIGSVTGTDVEWTTGAVKINGVAYGWPTADGTSGQQLTTNGSAGLSWAAVGGGGNSFETIDVPAGTDPVADSSTDTLTWTETSFLTLTGTAGTDTIDITQVTTDLGTDGLIAANAVALGTDTTNAYVADLSATTSETTVSGGGGETATVTIGLPDDVTITTSLTVVSTDPADAGAIRLNNAASIAFEASPAGTDGTFTYNASEQFVFNSDVLFSGSGLDITFTDTGAGADTFGIHSDPEQFVIRNNKAGGPIGLAINAGGQDTVSIGETGFAPTAVYVITDGTGNGEVALPTDSVGIDELDTADSPANAEVLAYQASTGRMVWSPDAGAAGGDSITVNASAATDPDFADGDVDWTLTGGNSITATVGCTGCVDTTDISDNTVTATDLNATLTFADADLVDLDAINNSATTEGVLLPQGTAPTGGTAEGQIGWDTDDDVLYVGDGTAAQRINGWVLQHSSGVSQTATFFAMPGGESGVTESNEDQWRMPLGSTCSNIYAEVATAPGAGNSWAVSLNVNGTASTAVTCTISGTGLTCSDTTGSESIAANDTLNFEFLESGTATGTGNLAASAFCQMN